SPLPALPHAVRKLPFGRTSGCDSRCCTRRTRTSAGTRIASGGQGREGGGGALASSRDRLGCWGRVPAQVHGHYTDTGGGIHEPPRTPRTLSRKLLLSRHTPPPPVSRTPAVDGLLAAVVDDQ